MLLRLLFFLSTSILFCCNKSSVTTEKSINIEQNNNPYLIRKMQFIGVVKDHPDVLKINFIDKISSDCLTSTKLYFDEEGEFLYVNNCKDIRQEGNWEVIDSMIVFKLNNSIKLTETIYGQDIILDNSDNKKYKWTIKEFNANRIELKNIIEFFSETGESYGVGGHHLILEK